MSWADRADRFIDQIRGELPADTDPAVVRRALRARAGEFHAGTSWGRRIWSRRCRIYLARFGHPAGSQAPARIGSRWDDIIFPYRAEPER